MRRFWTGLLLLALLLPTLPMAAAPAFTDPAFQRVWTRSDGLVAAGTVARTWFWGPQPNTGGIREDYAESPGGTRLVQYFDKSRMEINNPTGDQTSPFYVTNGRLTVELISGKMAVGDNRTVDRPPAAIPMSGDPGDPLAPTYAAFAGVSNTPLGDHKDADKTGQTITGALNHDGERVARPGGAFPPNKYAHFAPETGHNIADVFWTFLNQQGPVTENGATVTAPLITPWYYASGYPISDPYWAQQTVAGKVSDVLIQAFERRVLTYTPGNPSGFQVEMGNIGQHYYTWRYGTSPPPTVAPAPTATTAPSPSTPLQITGAVKTPLTLSLADLGQRKQQTVQAYYSDLPNGGQAKAPMYGGVLLYDLLMEAGGGGDLGRDLPGRYVVASGAGSQRIVLAWGEFDDHFTNAPILVALRRDGRALDAPALIPAFDAHADRYVFRLQKLEVVSHLLQTPPAGPLRLIGVPKPLTLTGADLAQRGAATTTVVYTAGNTLQTDTFTGVPLATLLREAGVTPDAPTLATKVFLASGDGRQAAVAGGELDQIGEGETVLIAYKQNGVPICCGANGTGSPRLIIASDRRGGRFIPHLTQLEMISP